MLRGALGLPQVVAAAGTTYPMGLAGTARPKASVLALLCFGGAESTTSRLRDEADYNDGRNSVHRAWDHLLARQRHRHPGLASKGSGGSDNDRDGDGGEIDNGGGRKLFAEDAIIALEQCRRVLLRSIFRAWQSRASTETYLPHALIILTPVRCPRYNNRSYGSFGQGSVRLSQREAQQLCMLIAPTNPFGGIQAPQQLKIIIINITACDRHEAPASLIFVPPLRTTTGPRAQVYLRMTSLASSRSWKRTPLTRTHKATQEVGPSRSTPVDA